MPIMQIPCLLITRFFLLTLVIALSASVSCGYRAQAQPEAYNPYSDTQEHPAPMAVDGTIQWGVFYKSASIQKSYERLWNLGACRGTNKAITVPVERNKFIIDNLPEGVFQGIVRGSIGSIAGGIVAFSAEDAFDQSSPVWVATLHPAGVSRLTVSGCIPATLLKPGMVIRVITTVDAHGKGETPIQAVDIVTPSVDFKPDEVLADRIGTIIGQVVQARGSLLVLQVNTGKIQRISLQISKDAVATLDASQLELVGSGDAIEVTGRLWSGEGAMGAGTIFASKVTVTKAEWSPKKAPARPAADKIGLH